MGIGYVPQGREIFSQLTVEEHLRIGLTSRKDAAAFGDHPIPAH
jgi:urea transport system ATP-binding protein